MPKVARPEPPYRQIAAHYRRRITSGALEPGARLPTLDQLAETWGVARVTAHRAYEVLAGEGLVSTKHRHGTFVSSPLPHHPTSEG